MRGLNISSLAFILALSSTVAVAAPRAAVSPVPKVPIKKGPLYPSCNINGPCSSSEPETCCGACVLVDSERGYCQDKPATCKNRGACNSFTPPGTCCGPCILIDSFNGYCLPPGSSIH